METEADKVAKEGKVVKEKELPNNGCARKV